MNYAIVTSSRTGNTAFFGAEAGRGSARAGLCVCRRTRPDAARRRPDLCGFLDRQGRLPARRRSVFGTAAGASGCFCSAPPALAAAQQYFAEILGRVRAHLDASNTVAGQFMCQGRMPQAVRRRFEAHAAGSRPRRCCKTLTGRCRIPMTPTPRRWRLPPKPACNAAATQKNPTVRPPCRFPVRRAPGGIRCFWPSGGVTRPARPGSQPGPAADVGPGFGVKLPVAVIKDTVGVGDGAGSPGRGCRRPPTGRGCRG